MRVRFIACCETCVQDVRSNAISLINVIDEITAFAFPFVIAKLAMVAFLERSPDDAENHQVTIRAELNDQRVLEHQFTLQFQGKPRTRAIADMNGFLVASAGTLRIELNLGEDRLAVWDITIIAGTSPAVHLISSGEGTAAAAQNG
jgi:hypothetical protein